MSRISVVVPSYNGVERCRFMLGTADRNDQEAFTPPWRIVEDPCGFQGVHEAYDELPKEFPVSVHHLDEWSNMHGAAKKAFVIATAVDDPEWIIYLGDDLAITPGSLTNMMYFLLNNPLETVGLVQFPYWNSHDLAAAAEREEAPAKLQFMVGDRFWKNPSWTDIVPPNPHWNNDHDFGGKYNGIARPYVNVNGAGFACRASTYRAVGGFQEGTWCLDETISVKTWLQTDKSIVALPGPPFVHYFGASTLASPPKHDLYTHERWEEAMGMSKATADALCREKMAEREPAVYEEMITANYWRAKA